MESYERWKSYSGMNYLKTKNKISKMKMNRCVIYSKQTKLNKRKRYEKKRRKIHAKKNHI